MSPLERGASAFIERCHEFIRVKSQNVVDVSKHWSRIAGIAVSDFTIGWNAWSTGPRVTELFCRVALSWKLSGLSDSF
jgi:hypothetical protein